MATKGVIHRNAAGRYKSRLTTRIAAKTPRRNRPGSSAPVRSALRLSGLALPASRGRPRAPSRTEFDDQTFQQDARLAGRSLEVEVGPEEGVDRWLQ